MQTKLPEWLSDESLAAELQASQQEQALALREGIEQRFATGELEDNEVQVGLKAFHEVCDKWAIGTTIAEAMLFTNNQQQSGKGAANVLDRIAYVLRINRLIDEVVQEDDTRKQRWIRRANLALEGHRPIDLMTAGPTGSLKVIEYLEFCQNVHSS